MNLQDYILDSPRSISGSHFSDYLYCKRRAWLNIRAKDEAKAPDPRYLKELQIEGRRFEKEIYSEPIFSNACFINEFGSKEAKTQDTINAIKKGTDYIMQAYFRKDDLVGVADILEKVSDINAPLGYYYKVGDIKSSKEVTTPYILQIMFYNEMLSEIQDYRATDGFIILGNRKRVEVEFSSFTNIYSSCKEGLVNMRTEDYSLVNNSYPPVLKSICSNCAFRYFCMGQLICDRDISLLPQLTSSRISLLRSSGIQETESLAEAISSKPTKFEFTVDETEDILRTIENINRGKPTFREYLSKQKLANLIPVTLELKDESSGTGLNEKKVNRIIYKLSGEIKTIELSDLENIPCPEEWNNHELILYGTDYIFFNAEVRQRLTKKYVKSFDLLKILENYIHYPFYGLELAVVNTQITKGIDTYIHSLSKFIIQPEERLEAIVNIVEWLIKGLPDDN